MKLIVGLGNPGPKYANTRHNIGFVVLDRLAERLNAVFSREKYKGLVAEARAGNEKLLLLKPQTYMNLSGESVAQAARNNAPSRGDVIVVYDDVALPLGRLRIRKEGSSGGHNGLRSIIASLGGQDFPRLRIGIGSEQEGRDLSSHVLGSFTPGERMRMDEAVDRVVDALQTLLRDGIDHAMNEYNRQDEDAGNTKAQKKAES